jgi:Fe2+ transport system protein FeoA
MKTKNLLEAPANKALVVLEINAGDAARMRLISMGIHIGDRLMKFNDCSWCPVLVRNITQNSSKIAIGQLLAAKILVRHDKS